MAVLLAAMLIYLGALEIFARTVVPERSRVQREYAEDYRAALALQPVTGSGATTALIVGNSLLRAGVDQEMLRRAMAPDYFVSVFPVDYTMYWDWYFGLRRLFADGARPAVVVVSLSPEQLVSDSTIGERFAHFLMRLDDLPQVARAARLDMTAASDYFFAHGSRWLGGRWEIRNWLFSRLIPGAAELVEAFVPQDRTIAANYTVERALTRLKALKALANANGAQFVFSIPPALDAANPATEIQLVSTLAGVPVLLPYRPGEMPRAAFSDGAHLDSYGAALYIERLQPALYRALSEAVKSNLFPSPRPLKRLEQAAFRQPLTPLSSIESAAPKAPFPVP